MGKTISYAVRLLPLQGDDFYKLSHHCHSKPHFAFLDSKMTESSYSRYSCFSFAPFAVARVTGSETTVEWWSGRHEAYRGNAFDILRTVTGPFQAGWAEQPPQAREFFSGGWIGYLGYELRHQLEELPAQAQDDTGIPHALLGLYNFALVLNHRNGQVSLVHYRPNVPCACPEVETLEAELMTAASHAYDPLVEIQALSPKECVFSLSRERYIDAVRRIREYILAGDIYQANFTQRFSVNLSGLSPWELYNKLMQVNPAPFAAYLDFGDVKVLSSSPERFVLVEGRRVETRPIKGTIRRGATPEEDRELREWLRNSQKNRAELAMIVDLMRNDIGKVCKTGSVRVLAFPEVESYPSLHHLVSTVEGELEEGKDVYDVLKATFPGGSITGAPKIRSMEIIDELEPVTRGVYTGSIGYLGLNGVSDLNIAIRTIVVADDTAYLGAGGGIVMDSDPEDEYVESLLKARNLLLALGIVTS